ncbi:280_t:CDS:2, partial [Rhizophagus irregularis]
MEDMHTVECNIPEFPDYGHLNIFKKKIHGIDEENIEEAIKDAFMQTDNVWKDKSFKFAFTWIGYGKMDGSRCVEGKLNIRP